MIEVKTLVSQNGELMGRFVEYECYEKLEKENAELRKEISILLSCSNCSENKGGYVCEKEYNDKCLAQKIEHIKELNEENAKLKAQIESPCTGCQITESLEEALEETDYQVVNQDAEIKQLKEQIEKMKCCENCKYHYWNYGDLDCRLKYSCYDTNYDKWELENDKF